MKGISIAIETVIYLILGVTVLSIALFFFLTQAGPAQDQYKLEADRNKFCGAYVSIDFECKGNGQGGVNARASSELLKGIGTACSELKRRMGFAYPSCSAGEANLECIKQCCFVCPQFGQQPNPTP